MLVIQNGRVVDYMASEWKYLKTAPARLVFVSELRSVQTNGQSPCGHFL